VNLSSASSIVPEPLMGIYNASKAALDNLTETLRFELSPQDIILKLIEPGFVPTTRLVEKALTNAPTLTIVTPDYEAYVNQRMAVFSSEFPFNWRRRKMWLMPSWRLLSTKAASCAGWSAPTRGNGCI
jgi:short-subunit dehydrogenase